MKKIIFGLMVMASFAQAETQCKDTLDRKFDEQKYSLTYKHIQTCLDYRDEGDKVLVTRLRVNYDKPTILGGQERFDEICSNMGFAKALLDVEPEILITKERYPEHQFFQTAHNGAQFIGCFYCVKK